MKKINQTISVLLIIGMLFGFSSCACSHEWVDATCTAPKTCSLCGETEGEPLGHDFRDATCTTPKTCSVCGETEGDALGHDFRDATCTSPKTCSVCGATEGKALGHTYSKGYCIRCDAKDPDYVDWNNYGFTNMYGMNKWLDIYAYNFPDNCVYAEANQDDELELVMFYDSYIYVGDIPIDQLRTANQIDVKMYQGFGTLMSKVLSNDVISFNDGTWETQTITERVVKSDQTAMIIKTKYDYSGDWYAPADLLDFSTITKIDDVDGFKNCYKINFK